MNRRKWVAFVCVLAIFTGLLVLPTLARATIDRPGNPATAQVVGQSAQTTEQKNEALIKAAQNPVANMVSVPFQNNFNLGYGPHGKMQYVCNIQPVYPIGLPHKWMLITRNILPVIAQPWPKNTGGLGDLTSSFFFTPPPFGDLMVGVGPVFQFPTATDRTLGLEKWSIGPTGVVVYSKGKWLAGALINNLWSYAGNRNRKDVNDMTLQPFINYNLPKSWFVFTSPIMTANWEAKNGEKWTLPIGGGVGKLLHFGKLPVNMSVQGFYNVERPRYQADWTVRYAVQFLFPKS